MELFHTQDGKEKETEPHNSDSWVEVEGTKSVIEGNMQGLYTISF